MKIFHNKIDEICYYGVKLVKIQRLGKYEKYVLKCI